MKVSVKIKDGDITYKPRKNGSWNLSLYKDGDTVSLWRRYKNGCLEGFLIPVRGFSLETIKILENEKASS